VGNLSEGEETQNESKTGDTSFQGKTSYCKKPKRPKRRSGLRTRFTCRGTFDGDYASPVVGKKLGVRGKSLTSSGHSNPSKANWEEEIAGPRFSKYSAPNGAISRSRSPSIPDLAVTLRFTNKNTGELHQLAGIWIGPNNRTYSMSPTISAVSSASRSPAVSSSTSLTVAMTAWATG